MASVPVYQEYMNPILEVLRREGLALPLEQIDRLVIEAMNLPAEVTEIPHDPAKPDRSEVSYRIAWSRTYLKKVGLIENPKRGRWGISEKGQKAGKIDAHALAAEVGETYPRSAPKSADDEDDDDTESAVEEDEELTTARVSEELARELLDVYARLAASGGLLAPDVATASYRRFRETFGPEVLAGLDGEPLLMKMHRRDKQSLMYWLEFKDDEEFPAQFGSIGGGSALKFGIYQAAETGHWMTGNSKEQKRLSVDEAVQAARKQRDQLIAASRILGAVSGETETRDYSALQASLVAAAPDVAETSWGHKYLSLIFPLILAPIHGEPYQHHQLYKLLKLPAAGRYENARIFAGVATQLGISLHDLASTLHSRNGGPHRYWRVGTTTTGKHSEWERMRLGAFAAIGWEKIGDLSTLPDDNVGRAEIRARVARQYADLDPGSGTKAGNQLFHFLTKAHERDVVIAMDGARVRAIGQVAGDYFYKPDDGPFPHRRPVKWLRIGDWKLPHTEAVRMAFTQIRKPLNIVDTEARLLGTAVAPPPASIRQPPAVAAAVLVLVEPQPLPVLEGVVARVNVVLQRKRQVILYGPPGTGKTYWAERAAERLAARGWFSSDQLDEAQRAELLKAGAVETCSFHPAYGYEDLLEGFRPSAVDGTLSFELRDGIFKRVCTRAAAKPNRPFFLIIDEINRGDIPRIFGELLTVLEREKRGKKITLPLSSTPFAVPDNVFVIGTMNTADRSIALLDAALRRRFGFVELLPDSSLLRGVSVGGLPLGPWLDELNKRIVSHVGRDARHLQIGHSYFLPSGAPVRERARFVEILRDDIIPLLEEYCYEDFEALERILGPKIVQRAKQRIDADLFVPERHGDLIQELMSAFEGITAVRDAIEADALSTANDAEDDENDDDPDQVASTPAAPIA